MSLLTAFIIMLSMCAVFIGAYFIRRQAVIRRNRFCPHCGQVVEVQNRSREVDPKKEPVVINGKRVICGKVKEYWSVLYCSHCGYERKI